MHLFLTPAPEACSSFITNSVCRAIPSQDLALSLVNKKLKEGREPSDKFIVDLIPNHKLILEQTDFLKQGVKVFSRMDRGVSDACVAWVLNRKVNSHHSTPIAGVPRAMRHPRAERAHEAQSHDAQVIHSRQGEVVQCITSCLGRKLMTSPKCSLQCFLLLHVLSCPR